MTLTLPDEPVLRSMSEAQIRLDLACALFAAGRLSRGVAARIAGLGPLGFDEALYQRQIPTFNEFMFEQDLAILRRESEK